jgi:hypothetical protein
MAKTDEAKTKRSNKKSVAKPKNNGSFEALIPRSSNKDEILKNSSKTSSGAGLALWPQCEGRKKKMVYDEKSQAMWYCKTCDGFGVD